MNFKLLRNHQALDVPKGTPRTCLKYKSLISIKLVSNLRKLFFVIGIIILSLGFHSEPTAAQSQYLRGEYLPSVAAIDSVIFQRVLKMTKLAPVPVRQKLTAVKNLWQRTSMGDRQLAAFPILNNLVIPGLISAIKVPQWVNEICDSLESGSQSNAIEHYVRGLYLAYSMELPEWAVRILLEAHESGSDNSKAARSMDIRNNELVLSHLSSLAYLDSLSGAKLKYAIQAEALNQLNNGNLVHVSDGVVCKQNKNIP